MPGFTPLRTVVGGSEEEQSEFQPLREIELGPAKPRNALAAGLSSGFDQLQGTLWSTGAAVADAAGVTGARDYMNEQARKNEIDVRLNGRPDLERIEDQTLGSALPYLGYQVMKQLPNAAGAIAAGALVPEVAVPTALARGASILPKALGGGGLSRGALGAAEGYAAKKALVSGATAAGETFGKQVVGGLAFNEAQSIGALYQEAKDNPNIENPGLAAIAMSPGYALLETVPEAMLVGRLAHGSGFSGNLLSRTAKSVGTQAASGAASELGQTAMELGVGKDRPGDEIASQFLNAGVAGGLVEGIFGLAGGRSKTPRAEDPRGEVGQALSTTSAGTTPVNTQVVAPQPPAAPVAPPTDTSVGKTVSTPGGDYQITGRDELGRPVWERVGGQVTAPEAPAAPQAPVVAGGTTDIPQAQAAAQQQAQTAQIQQQEQERRDQALATVGAAEVQGATGPGINVFGQTIFGPQVAQFGTALASQINKLPAHGAEVVKAIASAHTETGNKLVSFSYNGSPLAAANSLVKSLSKIADKFQIGHVTSTEQAAAILDAQSKTAKGDKLEQINAIHFALTGRDTTGFQEATSQPTKGATNGQLQVQNPAGVGTVREQGSAGETPAGNAGDVQPGGVQSLEPGSQPEGSLGLQVGQPAGSGVRNGSSGVPDVVGGDSTAPTQVTPNQELANEQGQSTPAQAGTGQAPAAQSTAVPGAPTAGLRQSGQTPRVHLVKSSQQKLAEQAEAITNEVMELLIPVHPKMKGSTPAEREASANEQRQFVFGILMGQHYASLEQMAADAGITLSQAKDWSAKALKFQTDPEHMAKLKAAYEAIAAKHGLTTADLLARINAKAALQSENTGVDKSISTSREQGGPTTSDDRALTPAADATVSDREANDEGLSSKRKSGESVQEKFNAVDTNNAAAKRTMEALESVDVGVAEGKFPGEAAVAKAQAALDAKFLDITKISEKQVATLALDAYAKGDEDGGNELRAELEARLQKQTESAIAQDEKNKRSVRAKAGKEERNLNEEAEQIKAEAKRKQQEAQAQKTREERKGLEVGDTVKNPKLGTGEVVSFAGTGEDTRVTVKFQSGQTKELMVSVAKLEKVNASEEQSAGTVDVGQQAGDGKAVGEGNPEPQKPAGKSESKTKHRVTYEGKPATLTIVRPAEKPDQVTAVTVKVDGERLAAVNLGAQGVVTDEKLLNNLVETEVLDDPDAPARTPQEQYETLTSSYPVPAWANLSEKQRDSLTDLAHRDQLNLAAVNTVLGGVKLENIDRLTNEPSVYGDEAKRTPSLSRGIATLRRMLDTGKITPEQFAARVEALHDQVKNAKEGKALSGRVRGADYIRQKLLEAKRRGDLSEKAVDLAEWFILKNPALVDDLAISLRGKGEDGASGNYSSLNRLMTLMKGSSNDETTVHEILHHLERMMPAPMQAAIRKAWLKSLLDASKNAKTPDEKLYYNALLTHHFSGQFMSFESVPADLRKRYDELLLLMDIRGERVDGNALASFLGKHGMVGYEHYQHFNPSEFWAVNGSRILEGRFDVSASMVGKLKQWLKEFAEKAKAVFGLKSDAAVIKALDSLIKGDGKFVTGQQMLMEGANYNMFAGITGRSRQLQAKRRNAKDVLDQVIIEDEEKTLGGLMTAIEMHDKGVPAEKIWYETGWGRGSDGQWRFEISDDVAKFKKDFAQLGTREIFDTKYQPEKLSDVLDHPALFEAYPELKNVKFAKAKAFMDFFGSTQGWFDREKDEIVVTPKAQDPLSTLLHEIQHWVQAKERFAPGGAPSATRLDNQKALKQLSKLLDEMRAEQGGKFRTVTEDFLAQSVNDLLTDKSVMDAIAKAYREHDDAVKQAAQARKEVQQARDDADAAFRAELAKYEDAYEQLEKQRQELYNEQYRSGLSYKDPRYKEIDKEMEANRAARRELKYPSPFDAKWKAPVSKAEAYAETLDKAQKAKAKELQQTIDDLIPNADSVQYYLYKLIAGEAEARNTQVRQRLSAVDRFNYGPEVTVDVPFDLQVVLDHSEDQASVAQNIERLPKQLQAPVRATTTNLFAGVKKAGLAFAITEDVVALAQKTMKSAEAYLKAQFDQMGARLNFENKVQGMMQQYDKLPANLQGTGEGSVNVLIHDMTMDGKWGFAPKYNPAMKLDPAMAQRFNAMPANAQKLIQDVFEHGYNALKAKQQAVKDAADRVFTERENAAKGDVKELADIALERKAFQAKFDRILKIKADKPYAYLGRYGNYIAVAKSGEYVEAQKLSKNGDLAATKWLKDNETSPDHYVVSFAETQGDADRIAADLKATGKYSVTDAYEKLAGDAYVGGGDLFLAFKRMENMVTRKAQNGAETAAVLDGIRKLMADMYLTTLAEASAHLPTLARKSTAGADKDMMRNLSTRGRADAHFLAALQHGNAVTDAMDAMIDEAEGNRRESTPVLNELLKRQSQSLQYKLPGTISQTAHSLSTSYFLTFNPAFYLQQMLQTSVLSLPYLAGRLGYFRSARAIRQAYNDVFPLLNGTNVTDHLDFDKAPADVRIMLQTLVGMGKIDIGIDYDAKRFSSGQSTVGKVMHKLQGVNTRIETINRATAAIAAYRGYLQKYGMDKTAAATKYAAEVVSNTHGSYDGFNTPRALSGDVGRVVGQFKRFQIIQLSMLAKLVHNAFRGADRDERLIAWKALGFITGHMAVLGGALGVPFVSQLGQLLLSAFGPDDEPDDLENYLRQLIGDKDVADLLLRGAPSVVGLESLGKKLSMEKTASLLPFTDLDISDRDALTKVYVSLLGPSAALSLQMADGLGMMRKGELYKGMEMMLPNGVANVMKANRYLTEGVSMRNGDTVMGPEEISMVDAAFQAVGLPTDTVTDRQRVQKVVADTDTFYKDKSAQVKHDYVKAFKAGDSGAMQDAREEWMRLQDSRARNGYSRQPLSNLFRAPMEQRKRERNVAGGVEFNKNNRRFVESQAE